MTDPVIDRISDRPWRLRFLAVWSSQSISSFGSALVRFALIWWLTKTTGKATTLAVATIVTFLPPILIGPFAGVFVDRCRRKAVLMISDAGIAITTAVLGGFYLFGKVAPTHVYAAILLRAIGNSVHTTAMLSTTPLLVPENQLTRVGGLNSTASGIIAFVAPALGALLIEIMGVELVLLVDIGTASIAVLVLCFIAIPQSFRAANGDTPEKVVTELAAGFRYVWHHRGIRLNLATIFLGRSFFQPVASFVPLLVTNHFGGGALELGWFESAKGIAIMIGGIVLAAWGGFRRRMLTSNLGLIVVAVGVLVLGSAPTEHLGVGIAGIFCVGLGMPFYGAPLNAVFQTVVPKELQGRFFSVYQSLNFLAAPIAMSIAGPIADRVGVRSFYLAATLAIFLMAAIRQVVPDIMHIEDSHPR